MSGKVLVVDDDPEDLGMMKRALEEEGYEVVAVSNANDALCEVSSGEYSLVLLDIVINFCTSYDMLRLLGEANSKGVKVLFVSIIPEKKVSLKGDYGNYFI